MTKILFSLPVHERPDIVKNQIENINYFCPDSKIIIHVSAGSLALLDEFKRNCQFDNVMINPQSLPTIWSAGIMHTHVSNFLYALEQKIDFDYVVITSSNELFVRHGLEDYISKYEIGSQTEVYDTATDWGVFREDFFKRDDMQNFMKALNLPTFFGGQTEGQFATRNAFMQVAKVYTDNFAFGPIGFPIEEVVLPTVAARFGLLGYNVGLPITLCNYCNNLQIDQTVVDQIRKGKGAFYAHRVPRALRSPHIGVSVLDSIFSVKRVPREDCDLRRYITSLMV